jgi:hypothetical protein
MKKTLQILNELVDLKIINEYAIAGGMAHFYYIEPSVTYDLDLIVNIPGVQNSLAPLSRLYDWAKKNNYKTEQEHILIGGIPVQFLLVYNQLVAEALENRLQISLFDEEAFILSPEYLMAIMLQTGRASDKERLIRFFSGAEYDDIKFNDIIMRFDLLEKYLEFKEKYSG